MHYRLKVWSVKEVIVLNAEIGFFFLKEIHFIQQGCIKLVKHDSEDIYNVTVEFDFKYMLFFRNFF